MRGEYMGVAITSRLVTVLKIHGVFAQSKENRLGRGLGEVSPSYRVLYSISGGWVAGYPPPLAGDVLGIHEPADPSRMRSMALYYCRPVTQEAGFGGGRIARAVGPRVKCCRGLEWVGFLTGLQGRCAQPGLFGP